MGTFGERKHRAKPTILPSSSATMSFVLSSENFSSRYRDHFLLLSQERVK